MKNNPISWIELPVKEMDRAIAFYNEVMGWSLSPIKFGDTTMAWLPHNPSSSGATGTLIHHPDHYTPSSQQGALVYLSCDDLADQLSRVLDAGGQIIQGKTQISEEHGFMAIILDSEGNRLALHANTTSTTMKKILVLCTGNSCRSQMAQGFINYYGREKVKSDSAGLSAKGVHPLAIKVMNEIGIDIFAHTSNPITDYTHDKYDVTLTVCDHAKETCPVFPQSTKTIHHTFRDPDHFQGTEQEVLDRFREIRDEISAFTKQLVDDLE